MTTESKDAQAIASNEGKKLSKKEQTQARIDANVNAIKASMSLDLDSLTTSGGKDALQIVAESKGSTLDALKEAREVEDEFALTTTLVMHDFGKIAAKANKEMKNISHTFGMTGRDHLDISVGRDGSTDLRMVHHATNTNAGPLKVAVADFGAAMAIFEAQESSADAVKEKA